MICNLEKNIESLYDYPDTAYYKFLLDQDPIRGKIEDEKIDWLIERAVKCGEEEADKVLNKYENSDLFEIAEKLGVDVLYTDSLETGYYGYFEEPKKIVIYNNSIEKAMNFLKKNTNISIEEKDLKKIILGHELFHFIEYEKPELFTNTFKIDLWSMFKYKRSSTVIYLGEIAGMAFVNKIINRKTYLPLLDYILLYDIDKEASEILVKELSKYKA